VQGQRAVTISAAVSVDAFQGTVVLAFFGYRYSTNYMRYSTIYY
jgi:hypothetical protein